MLKMIQLPYHLKIPELSHLRAFIKAIEPSYPLDETDISYWDVGDFKVSYGAQEIDSAHTLEVQKYFDIQIRRCSFVYRAPNTYYAPHKDRGGRLAALLFNVSEDLSPLCWFSDQSFGEILSMTDLSAPTLVDTQRAFHGIKELSPFWRKTFQIEFDNHSYQDLYRIFCDGDGK
jgi:hypothetical protein